jgi:hypothetical protein
MRRPLAVLASALAFAAALSGCGGGVSKESFVIKADAACAPGNNTLGALAQPSSLPELATAAGTVMTTVDTQADALRKIDPPGEDKAVVAAMIGALGEASAPARALQEAAGKTDDAATARAVNDLKAKADAAAAAAKGYGLASCAIGMQAPVSTLVDGGRTIIKAAFVARAESLCTAANKKAEALAGPTSLASFGRFLANYIPIEEKLLNDMKALVVPPGDETTVAEMLAAQDKVIANDKDTQAAAQKGNAAQVDTFDDLNTTLITAAHAKFDAYGLRKCGSLGNF